MNGNAGHRSGHVEQHRTRKLAIAAIAIIILLMAIRQFAEWHPGFSFDLFIEVAAALAWTGLLVYLLWITSTRRA